MTSSVTLPTDFANAQKAYGAGDGTQPMVGTPEFLVNLNATYDVEPLGTQLGLFYTWKGETLVTASYIEGGVLNPDIYQQPYGTLNFTISQRIIGGLNGMFNAKNLLNPEIETLYKAPGGYSAINSRYTSGVSLSFALVYQVEF
jgi:outer membrane receptor protein involved in Fe transport